MTTPRRVVFLDRDGTINVDHGYVSRVEDWEFIERAPEALVLLKEAGFKLLVVTNQSGAGRGYYTEDDVRTLHEHMRDELRKHGVTISGIAYCAHAPEERCACRKPETGMLDQLREHLDGVDLAASWTIGDKEKDAGFGRNVGTKVALIRSEYWTEGKLALEPDLVVDSLYEAARQIVSRGKE